MTEPTRHPGYEVLPPEGDDDPARRDRRRWRRTPRGRMSRFAWPLTAAVAVAVAVVVGAVALSDRKPLTLPDPANGPRPATATFRAVQQITLPSQAVRRVVYPYSVIPGGARDRADLSDAVGRDRVVALHYATFDTSRAEPIRVDTSRRVHVSYRLGDKIYWTRRTVALHPGETLLTDGVNEVRARCGNRVSNDVIGETSSLEPSESVLDTPVLHPDDSPTPGLQPLQAYDLFAANNLMPPTIEGGMPPLDSPGSGGYQPYSGSPGFYGAPGSSRSSNPPPTDGGTPPPGPPVDPPPEPPPVVPPGPPPVVPPEPPGPPEPPPPAQVPEPGTLTLLAAGCALLAVRRFSRPS